MRSSEHDRNMALYHALMQHARSIKVKVKYEGLPCFIKGPKNWGEYSPYKKTVYLSDNMPSQSTENSILAHELGHAICKHRELPEDADQSLVDAQEKEAWDVAEKLIRDLGFPLPRTFRRCAGKRG